MRYFIVAFLVDVLMVAAFADINIFVGDMSNASALNGGCADISFSASDVIGTNGAAIDPCICNISNNGSGKVRCTVTSGMFDDADVGMWAYFDSDGTHADGRYEIIAVDASNNWIDLDLAYVGDETSRGVNVGGAVPESELENVMDATGYPASPENQSENVFVRWYDGGDGYARSTQWLIDAGAGAGNEYFRYLIGCDDSFDVLAAESYARVYASVSLGDDELVRITVSYQVFQNIEFDAQSKASYPVYHSGQYLAFLGCSFHGGTSFGIYQAGAFSRLVDCEIYDNDSHGYFNGTRSGCAVIGSHIHDNGGRGMSGNPEEGGWIGNEVYDNGSYGIEIGSAANTTSVIIYNTVYGNASDGIYVNSSARQLILCCNTSVGNSGYGFNVGASIEVTTSNSFGWNHAYDNTLGNTNLSGTWSDLGLGGNVTGDPLFTSVVDGSEDFRPLIGSPLIQADMLGRTIGAREPLISGGGRGAGIGTGIGR